MMIGQTISHYKITGKLGEGGMGVVYKAEDIKLRRIVALKFLSTAALGDEDEKARFSREAQAAAMLDHPNIAAVHDIEEMDGRTFMAMAFIDGPTIGEKVKERPLKMEEALDIAIQICEGLKEAHEQGVTHRDVKPANIMLTRKGRVKITDFGLAHLAGRSKLTKSGTTLGTPAYMSPEQALGEPTDRRSDVWGVAIVLYEMLAGRPPFVSEHEQAIIYSIINEDPEPLTAVRTGLPTELDRVMFKGLAKRPAERYQHVDDMLVDLRRLQKKLEADRSASQTSPPAVTVGTQSVAPGRSEPAAETRAQQASPLHPEADSIDETVFPYHVIERLSEKDDSVVYRAEDTQLHRSVAIRVVPEFEAHNLEKRRQLQRRGMFGMAALAVLSLAFGVSQWLGKPSATEAMPLRKFSFTPPEKLSRQWADLHVAVSPNGRYVAFVAGDARSVWIRDLANEQAREIPGTENAQFPFWSPDSQFVGFGTDKELKKISVEGATTITLCELPFRYSFGGSWSPDGDSIVFASDNPVKLYEVPARGGTPKLLFEPEDSEKGPHAIFPHFLPPEAAARSVVFAKGSPSNTEIVLKNLETGERSSFGTGVFPRYSSTGHIVYQTNDSDGGLWALPFSIKTLQPTGEAFPIAQDVGSPSIATDGTLVYADFDAGGGLQQLVWIDREGRKLGEIGQPQESIGNPDLSPDERRVAAPGIEGDNRDIWIHDTDRPVKTRFTFDRAWVAAWTPSGKEITFTSARSGNADLFTKPADGSGEAEVLVGTPVREGTPEWSLDGRYLIYNPREPETQRDLAYRERQQDGSLGEAVVFLQTEFEDAAPKFSPDGRFVVYTSDESGRFEVYVRSFPEGTGRRQISIGGGTQPRWSRDGKEIFYVERDTLMVVGVTTTPSFSTESPEVLFEHPGLFADPQVSPQYDVANDGRRFVLRETLEADKPISIHVVQNWFAEFKDRQTGGQ